MLRLALLSLWLPVWSGLAVAQTTDPMAQAVAQAANRVGPALVRIHVVSVAESEGRQVKYESSGSGVIISKEGHVITNHHVARRATRLVCVLPTNEEIEADLVGTDPLADIAVIKLRDVSRLKALAPVEFGDSDKVRVGDSVLAMGSPLALSQSVTLGIVSNARMILPGGIRGQGQFTLDGEDVGSMVRWIGHDAEIQPGNSGGPLVNVQGQVIGINELGIGSMSGAIPGNLARGVAEQLIQHGRVSRSWLGLQAQPLLKQDVTGVGVLVSDVTKDSPAAVAGVRSGDVLVRVAGQEVRVKFWEELPLFNQLVAQLPVGRAVELVVRRDGAEQKLTATTADRERALPGARELKEWGMTVRDLSARLALELRRENRAGVLVTSVRPGGAAGQALPALRAGDVITAVNDLALSNCAALAEWSLKAVAATNAPVPTWVSFDRKAEKLATVAKVGLRDMDDPSAETPKAWLPVALQAVTREMAAQRGEPKLTGVRVTQVFGNSTAEKAGLKIGDWLVGLDGDAVAVGQLGEEEVFWRQIRQYKIGTTVELKVRRGAETLTVPVELARAPRAEREMKKYRDTTFEFVARDLTFRDRVDERRPEDLQGALVTEVKGGGWAALGRLGAGDIIVAVNGQAVADVESLQGVMKQVAGQRPKTVVWRVLRGIHTLYLESEPDWGNHRPVVEGDLE